MFVCPKNFNEINKNRITDEISRINCQYRSSEIAVSKELEFIAKNRFNELSKNVLESVSLRQQDIRRYLRPNCAKDAICFPQKLFGRLPKLHTTCIVTILRAHQYLLQPIYIYAAYCVILTIPFIRVICESTIYHAEAHCIDFGLYRDKNCSMRCLS